MCTLPADEQAAHGPGSVRSTSGRQTLGSNHDAPQRGPQSHDVTPGTLLGVDIIRIVWWSVFTDYCNALEGENRRTAERLISHVELGWAYLRQLQLECERQRASRGASPDRRVAHLIGYVERDLFNSFTECAAQTARVFSTPQDSREWLDALHGIASQFERAVAMCALAGESTHIPRGFKTTLEQVANALVDWSVDYCALVTVMAGARQSDSGFQPLPFITRQS